MLSGLSYLIAQFLLTVTTCFVAIYQLRKEFRRKTNIAKKEAKNVRILLIIIALITVLVQVIAYCDATSSQNDLKQHIKNLENKNDSLSNQIKETENFVTEKINSSKAALALQASQNALEASANIHSSAIRLSNYINGSDLPPEFAVIRASREHSFVLKNIDSLRANIDAFVVNYDDVLLCQRNAGRVDRNCYKSNQLAVSWEYILPRKQIPITLPKYSPDKPKSKFFICITLTKSEYVIEVIFQHVGSFATQVSSRTLKKINGLYKVYKINEADAVIKVDWDNEFILPYDEKFGDL
ncbi:MAG: hypothetical protein HYI21_08140 [Sediminibacterium sp. Gen4]|jgi:hypothetical protein|uniref:hypothetical protein n=1 Tax=unclassified Sediminibacterium TaxID=2635961 RepID=UPI0015BC8D58|nr:MULTISPECIES: hypothetical protein [unclassified Sediminibacterium]MBW0161771.1 hypothetical protein [Sediminibacterium sp.]MBW0164700.1 hypothetical protein [Sediminibacterium sp.]NWK65982.1 hypothetical protein [Sediminibacterium sp. Gen4]